MKGHSFQSPNWFAPNHPAYKLISNYHKLSGSNWFAPNHPAYKPKALATKVSVWCSHLFNLGRVQ